MEEVARGRPPSEPAVSALHRSVFHGDTVTGCMLMETMHGQLYTCVPGPGQLV